MTSSFDTLIDDSSLSLIF